MEHGRHGVVGGGGCEQVGGLEKVTCAPLGGCGGDSGAVAPGSGGALLAEAGFDPAHIAGDRFGLVDAVRGEQMRDEMVGKIAVSGVLSQCPPRGPPARGRRDQRLGCGQAGRDGVHQGGVELGDAVAAQFVAQAGPDD